MKPSAASLPLPDEVGPGRWLVRYWHMLRNVPPRQLLRRAELLCRYRLAPLLPDSPRPPPPLRDDVPPPVLPRHPERGAFAEGRLKLRLPWGERVFPEPIAWDPGTRDEETVEADWANLHYMEFLEGLDDDAFRHLIEDWIRNNPRRRRGAVRYAWRPYNLSIRVVVWMRELAHRRSRLDPDVLAFAARSLAAQIRFLEHHLETDLRGNHLIRNLRALLAAGRFFAGPEAGRWQRLGSALLAAELDEQILADGCHYERSPSYHCQVLGDLLECRAWLPAGPLRERLDERLAAMVRAARLLDHPDGRVALFNDGGLHVAPTVEELEGSFTALLGPPPTPPAGAFALPEAGYWGFHDRRDVLIVDCGPLGPDYLVGHGHCDMLSFEWSVDGRRLIVDQGTYRYPDSPRRRVSRRTASHNTLAIEGIEQSDVFGAFRCGRRARPHLRLWRPRRDGFAFEGAHDGYRTLPGRPLHIRRIDFDPARLRVTDRLDADPGRRASVGFLLHPDCRIERLAANRLRIRRETTVVEMDCSHEIAEEAAEWYPDLYVVRPALRLRAAVTPPAPTVTTFRPQPPHRS